MSNRTVSVRNNRKNSNNIISTLFTWAVSLTLFEANVDVKGCFRMLVMVLSKLRLRDFIYIYLIGSRRLDSTARAPAYWFTAQPGLKPIRE